MLFFSFLGEGFTLFFFPGEGLFMGVFFGAVRRVGNLKCFHLGAMNAHIKVMCKFLITHFKVSTALMRVWKLSITV